MELLKGISDIPEKGFIPEHIEKWGIISKFMSGVPAVEIELTRNGGLCGEVYIEQPQNINIEEENKFDGWNHEIGYYVHPPTFGEKIETLFNSFCERLFGFPAKKIEKPRYYPDALFLINSDEKEICLFDQNLHGWDAIECDYRPEVPRDRIKVTCMSCGALEFRPRFSWVGYQVFDGNAPNPEGAIKFRNSFDSIAIEITCLNCGKVEDIVNAETA